MHSKIEQTRNTNDGFNEIELVGETKRIFLNLHGLSSNLYKIINSKFILN